MAELPAFTAFQATLNSDYAVRHDAHPGVTLPTLRLIEASVGGDRHHESLSMVFEGSRELLLPQSNYRLDHPELGEHLLFIVPIGDRNGAYQYQCIINRMSASG